jgi:Holliday junction resolvasome RuvABC endonuclease subunit
MIDIEFVPSLRVVGIDSALSRTGIGIIEFDGRRCRAQTHVIATELSTPAPGADKILTRRVRIGTVARRAARIIPMEAELALIEGPALDADYGNAWDRAHVWWSIIDILALRGIPVAEVVPSTLKQWATKSGRATKELIVESMHSMWPGVPCTTNKQRHHECESLAMATMCAQRLGWPVSVRGHQGRALTIVKWPPSRGLKEPR